MQIQQPYLLFLGDVTDPLAAKTARGIYKWRKDACVGQLRLPGCEISVGIDDLTIQQGVEKGAKTFVLGTANAGGYLPQHWLNTIKEAIQAGLHIANGLHQRLNEIPELVALAEQYNVELIDVRHYQEGLTVGSGLPRSGKRVLMVGTDCAVGKMYSALALEVEMKALGLKTDFCATGQTGILIAGSGVPVDAVISDFISGAAEQISPDNDEDHWDIIEGQGSLFHASFAGVSLGLLHGSQPDYLVMCHELGRPHMRHLPHYPVVDMQECVMMNLAAAKVTSPSVQLAGFSINTSGVSEEEARAYCASLEAQFGVPATDPIRFGSAALAKLLHERA